MFVTSTAFFEYKEDGGRFPNPPSYSVATTLPSYDEAERSKEEAAIPLVTGRVTVNRSYLHLHLEIFLIIKCPVVYEYITFSNKISGENIEQCKLL